jgi:capsular exopolysaccharide synthesis family protein
MSEQTTEAASQWQQFLRVLRRRAVTGVIFFGVTAGIVIGGTMVQTPIYRATATMLIDMEAPTVLAVNHSGDDTTIGQQNYMTYADYYRTQLEVIGSRALAKKVYRNLKLWEQEPYKSLKDRTGFLVRQIEIEPVKQTRLAKIRVEDTDPKRAAAIANELGRVFAEENLMRTVAAEAMTLMKNEYLKLQARESELSKRYKDKHPAMIRVHAEMQQLGQQIEAQRQAILGEARVGEGEAGEADGDKPAPAPIVHPLLMANVKPNNIRVQDPASAPSRPVKPKKELIIGLGLLMALLGAGAVMVIQELLDGSVKAPEDVEHDGRLTLLGYVPRSSALRVKSAAPGTPARTIFDRDPYSQAAEAYRTLRTSLLQSLDGKGNTVVFTSPAMGEGKTTTVSHLGIALAQSGLRVLLIDADLRKGRLHELFGAERNLGLSDVLTARASLEDVVKPTGTPGLSLITTGSIPGRPAELLGSPEMRALLDKLSGTFDRILIDSPPVIAVTDAAILASMTQAVVAVAQSGRTPRQALLRIAAMCRQAKAKLIGVILNNVAGYDTPVYARYAAYRYAAPEEDGATS